MADKESLRDKFELAADYDWVKQKSTEEPGYTFPFFIETSKLIEKWPDGISPNSSTNNDRHFYTFRMTYEDLRRVGSIPDVKAITIK